VEGSSSAKGGSLRRKYDGPQWKKKTKVIRTPRKKKKLVEAQGGVGAKRKGKERSSKGGGFKIYGGLAGGAHRFKREVLRSVPRVLVDERGQAIAG